MPYTITAATLIHAPLLAQIGAETFMDTFGAANTAQDMDTYIATAFSLHKIEAELADSNNTFYLAYQAETPVGYCKLSSSPQPTKLAAKHSVEIGRLYVIKAWQHKGVGAWLMQHCLSVAQDSGYNNIWLQVWQQNPRAIAFYKKWGFKIFDTKVFVLGSDRQDDFLMQRDV